MQHENLGSTNKEKINILACFIELIGLNHNLLVNTLSPAYDGLRYSNIEGPVPIGARDLFELVAVMQDYYFYWLDFQGKPIRTMVMEFADDLSALESATELCRDHSIDVFRSGRRVARLKKGNAPLDRTDRTSL